MLNKTIMCIAFLAAALILDSCQTPACHGKTTAKKQLTLTSNGKTDYRLVIAESCPEPERLAATQLHEYLKKLTGVDFPILKENQVQPGGKNIFIGNTAAARGAGYDSTTFDKEEWLIKTLPDGDVIIAGGQPRGTLYGTFEFLEKFGDVVWTDEYSEYVPMEKEFSIPIIDIRDKPCFWLRSFVGGRPVDMEKFKMFHLRNKYNYAYMAPETGSNEKYGSPGMCHTFYAYSKDWPRDKPEYFSLNDDGQRLRANDGGGPGQICLMNKDVRDLIYKRLLKYIKTDRSACTKSGVPFPRLYVIEQNDNMHFCKCPECKALAEKEGSFSGPMLDFINDLADRIKKDYPDIYLSCIAYTKLAVRPPKTIRPRDNVLIRVCDLGAEFGEGESESLRKVSDPQNVNFKEIVESWGKISKHMGIWEYWVLYNKPFAVPYSVIGNLEDDFRFYKKNHVETMLVESEYTEQTSFFALKRWLGLKLMQNPDLSVKPLVEKFMKAYYGKAAGTMSDYLDYLEKRQNENPEERYGKMSPYQYKYLDLDFFVTANSLLDKAGVQARDDKDASIHIRHERVPVDSAMLSLWKKLEKDSNAKLPFSRKEILARYETNGLEQIARFVPNSGLGKDKLCISKDEFNNRITALKLDLQPPEHIKNPAMLEDIFWAEMRELPHLGSTITDDKDACGGKALKLVNVKKIENFFGGPLEVYVYNTTLKKRVLSANIQRSEIIADGKYHWYDLGKVSITPGSILMLHRTSHLQTPLDKAVNPNPEWNLQLSLKFSGPAYITGSKEEDAIWLDRIVLTK
ncbi:MAG: hypothetical protein A2020_05010 [Lentisphaerae bacterium GWF2_45_14]|nr:MAG: hypothetical protein A2020_05010 [Lentisphaerae bacterium GWF2_45_14]